MFDFFKKGKTSLSIEEINAKVIEANCWYFGKNGYCVDKSKAFDGFKLAAKNGNVYSQLMLGYMYDYGDGIPANVSKAIEWYTRASDAGDGNATLNLANIYLLGRNVQTDKQKGIAFIKKAAEQGNPVAASSLGREYTIGDVLPKSINDATYWIDWAESKGYINCQTVTNLGLMYDKEKMYEKAFDYFTKAIEADPNITLRVIQFAKYKYHTMNV